LRFKIIPRKGSSMTRKSSITVLIAAAFSLLSFSLLAEEIGKLNKDALFKAVNHIKENNPNSVVIEQKEFFLFKSAASLKAPFVKYLSNTNDILTIRVSGDEPFGLAFIDGREYNISKFGIKDITVSPSLFNEQAVDGTHDAVKAEKKSSPEALASTQNISNAESLSLYFGDELVTAERVNVEVESILSQQVFNETQLSQIVSSAPNFKESIVGGNDIEIKIDQLIYAETLLNSYKSIGAGSQEYIRQRVLSGIDATNARFANSTLTDLVFTEGLFSAGLKGDVGSSWVSHYNEDEVRILSYVAPSDIVTINENRVCGFTGSGGLIAMLNISERGLGRVREQPATMTIADSCVAGRTYAHEIGHILGLNHERGIDGQGNLRESAPYGFNYGADNIDEKLVSTMSYGAFCDNCFDAGRFSSPTEYDYKLGEDSYDPEGADAVSFMNVSKVLFAADKDKKPRGFTPNSEIRSVETSDGVFKDILFTTLSWGAESSLAVRTLVVGGRFGDPAYFFPIPQGQNSVTFPTQSGPTVNGLRVVEGYYDNGNVQGLVTAEYINSVNLYSLTSATQDSEIEMVYGLNKIVAAGVYEFTYEVSQEFLDRAEAYSNSAQFVEFELDLTVSVDTSVISGNVNGEREFNATGQVVSTLDDLFDSREIVIRIDVKTSSYGAPKFIAYGVDAYNAIKPSVSFNAIMTSLSTGQTFPARIGRSFDVIEVDEKGFIDDMLIRTENMWIEYDIDEITDNLNIPFVVKQFGSEAPLFELVQGYVIADGDSAAATIVSKTELGNGLTEVMVSVDTKKINQQFGDGYYVGLRAQTGIKSDALVVLKNEDVPIFSLEKGTTIYRASAEDTLVSFTVTDVRNDHGYEVRLLDSASATSPNDFIIPNTYTGVDVMSVSFDFEFKENFTSVPIRLEVKPTSIEGGDLYILPLVLAVNTPPQIGVVLRGEFALLTVQDGIAAQVGIEVDGLGDFILDIASGQDTDEGQILSYSWTAGEGAFAFTPIGDGSDISIAFPQSVDDSWQSYVYTMTVNDGFTERSIEIEVLNKNYNDPNATPTPAPAPTPVPTPSSNQSSGDDSGGGSVSFGMAMILTLIAVFRRRQIGGVK
jgi:hypothetical protein